MRRCTVALEFVIASIDGPSVLVSRMSDFGPVPAAALAALDFVGEDGYAGIGCDFLSLL